MQTEQVIAVLKIKNLTFIRIGFGRYQIQLFLLTGLGWAADSELVIRSVWYLTAHLYRSDIWLQGVAIILPQIQKELNPVRVEFATLSLYVGLILGNNSMQVKISK
jgi:hypothetical protein